MPNRPVLGLWLASAAWLGVVALGFAPLFSYAAKPGASGPEARQVAASPADRARLIMTLHPRCGCSHASLRELDRLVAHLSRPTEIHLVFVGPDDGRDTALFDQARAIPGAIVERDPDGAQARLLGAQTSGDAFYYDAGGALRFHGGLTTARGHEGEGPGTDAILALDARRQTTITKAPAFGCGLETPP